MTSKADFTDSEWEVLLRAPMVAGMGITFADPAARSRSEGDLAVLKFVTPSRPSARTSSGRSPAPSGRCPSARTRWAASHAEPWPARRSWTSFASRRDREREGHPGGGGSVPQMAAGVRPACRRGGEGGRLHGLQRGARQRGGGAHARRARIDPRRRARLDPIHPKWGLLRRVRVVTSTGPISLLLEVPVTKT